MDSEWARRRRDTSVGQAARQQPWCVRAHPRSVRPRTPFTRKLVKSCAWLFSHQIAARRTRHSNLCGPLPSALRSRHFAWPALESLWGKSRARTLAALGPRLTCQSCFSATNCEVSFPSFSHRFRSLVSHSRHSSNCNVQFGVQNCADFIKPALPFTKWCGHSPAFSPRQAQHCRLIALSVSRCQPACRAARARLKGLAGPKGPSNGQHGQLCFAALGRCKQTICTGLWLLRLFSFSLAITMRTGKKTEARRGHVKSRTQNPSDEISFALSPHLASPCARTFLASL